MKILLSLILIPVSSIAFSQRTAASIMKDFQSGRLFLVNNYAIADADSSFFEQLSQLEIINYEQVSREIAKPKFGTIAEKGAILMTVLNASKLNDFSASKLDSKVLKHFNQEDSLLYHTNGVPNTDVYYALNSLIDMKIETIQKMGPNQAIALWGTQGENGAVVINYDRENNLLFKDLHIRYLNDNLTSLIEPLRLMRPDAVISLDDLCDQTIDKINSSNSDLLIVTLNTSFGSSCHSVYKTLLFENSALIGYYSSTTLIAKEVNENLLIWVTETGSEYEMSLSNDLIDNFEPAPGLSTQLVK